MPWLEFKIGSLCETLMDTVTLTRRHAEKQQARSVEEKEAEIAEEEFGLLPVKSAFNLHYLLLFIIITVRCTPISGLNGLSFFYY